MALNTQKLTTYTDSISSLPNIVQGQAATLKAMFDSRTDNEVKTQHNALIDELQLDTVAAELGATVPSDLPVGTTHKIQNVIQAVVTYAKTHMLRTDNPHSVTATQAGAYTIAQTNSAIDAKVAAIGAGDMAKAEYAGSGYGIVARADVAVDQTARTAATGAQTTADTAVTNAATAQTTANTAVTNAATAQTTANNALPRAGGTMTGAEIMGTTSAQDIPIRFVKNTSGDYYAIQATGDVFKLTNRLANGTVSNTPIEISNAGAIKLPVEFSQGINFGTTAKVAQNGAGIVSLAGDNGALIVNYAGSAFRSITAASFIQNTSSIRYKERITDMTDDEAKLLLQMRPVEFYRKNEPDKRCTGFIAEEVEAIQPKFVFYNDLEDGTKQVESLDYMYMVTDLVKLCQIQQKEINDLKARVESLEVIHG